MTFYLPTSSKVKIMIKGIDLDLAFRLDWKQAHPRIPVYGYNDQEYTKTIAGRKLIQGFLVMNYVAPHYLTSFLAKEDQDKAIQQRSDAVTEVFDVLPPTQTAAQRTARAQMISTRLFQDAKPKGYWDRQDRSQAPDRKTSTPRFQSVGDYRPDFSNQTFKEQLLDVFVRGGLDPFEPDLISPTDLTRPFPMTIYHMEPEYAPWYIVLEDVEITDVSQTMSAAGADGSSDPLYETYEFIAKRRQVHRSNRPSKGRKDI